MEKMGGVSSEKLAGTQAVGTRRGIIVRIRVRVRVGLGLGLGLGVRVRVNVRTKSERTSVAP